MVRIDGGRLGGVMMLAWPFVVNGFLGFGRNVDMEKVPDGGRHMPLNSLRVQRSV